jgi:hypothetical protein
MLLLIVIAIAWLAVLALFAALCRAAATGDRSQAALEQARPISIGPRLTLSAAPKPKPPVARTRRERSDVAPRSRRLAHRQRSVHGAH